MVLRSHNKKTKQEVGLIQQPTFSTPQRSTGTARKSLVFNISAESPESTISGVNSSNSSNSSQTLLPTDNISSPDLKDKSKKMPETFNCTLGNLIDPNRKPVVPPFTPPQSYNPDCDNLAEFLENYDKISQINNWDDNIKLGNFSLYLVGQAQTWLKVYALRNPNSDWKATVEALKNEFSFNAFVNETKLKLRYRRQQQGENVMNYLRDILYLCDKVDPKMSNEVRREHFEQGLLPTYAYQIKLQKPNNFEEVQKLVKNISDAEIEISHATELVKQINMTSTTQEATTPKLSLAEEIAQIVRKEVGQAMQNLNIREGINRNRFPRTTDSRPVCFQCGKPGHKKAVCFNNPQNKQSRGYKWQNASKRWPTQRNEQNGHVAGNSHQSEN